MLLFCQEESSKNFCGFHSFFLLGWNPRKSVEVFFYIRITILNVRPEDLFREIPTCIDNKITFGVAESLVTVSLKIKGSLHILLCHMGNNGNVY